MKLLILIQAGHINLSIPEHAKFTVTVRNNSQEYDNCRLSLRQNYNKKEDHTWYTVTPTLNSLIPPGASKEFSLIIRDTPIDDFVGKAEIDIIGSSLNSTNELKTLKLNISKKNKPLEIKLSKIAVDLKKFLGKEFSITCKISNPNRYKVTATCKLLELDFLEDQPNEESLELKSQEEKTVTFKIKIPEAYHKIFSENHKFYIHVIIQDDVHPTVKEGILQVLPYGGWSCTCQEPENPTNLSWKFWRSNSVTYDLTFSNKSNVIQDDVSVIVAKDKDTEKVYSFEVNSEKGKIDPGEEKDFKIKATYLPPRPWLGQLQVINQELYVNGLKELNEKDRLTEKNPSILLILQPIIPFFLQIALGSLLVLSILLFLYFQVWKSTKHDFAVNSVQFNDKGDKIISGSDDDTAIAWRVNGFDLWKFWLKPKIAQIGKTDKKIRIVRYDNADNNRVAVGLENGQIQIWDSSNNGESYSPKYCFPSQKDDRVLALEFSDRGQYLFSGHGSGKLIQWDLANPPACDAPKNTNLSDRNFVANQEDFHFPIYALKLIGNDQGNERKTLVVSGGYNKLVLWNWSEQQKTPVSYLQEGGQNNYIFTLATAKYNPYLLATGDTDGYIGLWNIQECLNKNIPSCKPTPLQNWIDPGKISKPSINSLALDDQGCYLVRGGGDGKLKLWTLQHGKPTDIAGKEIGHSNNQETFYSVDIKTLDNQVLVASGSGDSWVRLTKENKQPDLHCDRLSPKK